MLRRIAERLSRGRVLNRRFPSEFGQRRLYVSPDAALSYLKRNWWVNSADLLAAASRHTGVGDNVWDIGANVGVFSFAAAHRGGPGSQVVAVEADPFLASLVQKSADVASNRDLNVNVVCAAASDEIGISRFLIAERGRASSSLERSGQRTQAGGTRSVQYVPTITLDSLLDTFHPPALIKIDVEGAEEFVLAGGQRVLKRHRPKLYIEVGSAQDEAVASILHDCGYLLFDGDSPDGPQLSGCAFNTLAVPQEAVLARQTVAA